MMLKQPLLLCSLMVLLLSAGAHLPDAPDAPPPQVLVSPSVVREVTDYQLFTGRTQAVATVDLRARVTGYLDKALFKEGGEVKAGEVLFQIDPRPYQADLSLAEANLKQAEAERNLQEKAVARAEKLLGAAGITREEYDQSLAALEKARAAVAAQQAARERARLYLSWTRVSAPMSGRISRRFVDPGNLVNADTTLLGTIVSQDPMYVHFDLDERTALRLMRLARDGKAKPLQEGKTPAYLGLADEEGFPRQGIMNFVDNQVNPDTGTLRCRAVFPNADGMLLPGLLARIRLPVGSPHQALLVPEEAIGSDQGHRFLYVVDDQNKVASRRVQVGAAHDGLRVILEGLKPGERVITAGLERLRPGIVVEPTSR
jgi:RND family efflux transporter MFP subunit